MNIKRGEIKLTNLQVKSLESVQRLSKALNEIEEQCGIHSVNIIIENAFVCPWIDLEELNDTGMECLIRGFLKKFQ